MKYKILKHSEGFFLIQILVDGVWLTDIEQFNSYEGIKNLMKHSYPTFVVIEEGVWEKPVKEGE